VPEPDQQVRGGQPEKLTARVDRLAVLRGERTRCGNALDVGEQQACARERNETVHLARTQRRQSHGRETSRNQSDRRDATDVEPRRRAGDDCEDHDAQCHGPPREQPVPRHQKTECRQPDGERQRVRVADLLGQRVDPAEEVIAAARHAEQLRQLRRGDGQPCAGLEPQQHRLADEVGEGAEPQRPGDHTQYGHLQRRQRGDRAEVHRIAGGERGNTRADQHRDGGRRPYGEVARRSQRRVAEPTEQVPVDAHLGRQAR
jgi:hypothetical protein